jgi:hypothetical protein
MPGAPPWSAVIDPTEVTRIALQNAASIASPMLMAQAMVAEIPEKNWPAPRWLWAGRNELLNLTRFPVIQRRWPEGAWFRAARVKSGREVCQDHTGPNRKLRH